MMRKSFVLVLLLVIVCSSVVLAFKMDRRFGERAPASVAPVVESSVHRVPLGTVVTTVPFGGARISRLDEHCFALFDRESGRVWIGSLGRGTVAQNAIMSITSNPYEHPAASEAYGTGRVTVKAVIDLPEKSIGKVYGGSNQIVLRLGSSDGSVYVSRIFHVVSNQGMNKEFTLTTDSIAPEGEYSASVEFQSIAEENSAAALSGTYQSPIISGVKLRRIEIGPEEKR